MEINKETSAEEWWERYYKDVKASLKATSSKIGRWVDNDVKFNDWFYDYEKIGDKVTGKKVTGPEGSWCSVATTYFMQKGQLTEKDENGNAVVLPTAIFPTKEEAQILHFEASKNVKSWYESQGRYHSIEEVQAGTYTPKKGDIFFKYTIGNDLHSGLVTEYNKEKKKISTVDGNTNNSPDNPIGYGVFEHKNRDIGNYIGFGDNFYNGGGAQ